jgi:hypothetical protein
VRAPGVLPVAFPTSFRWIGRKHSVALHCRKTSRRPPPPGYRALVAIARFAVPQSKSVREHIGSIENWLAGQDCGVG